MSDTDSISKPILVYCTGFGPFEGHESVNASWEAVRQLPSQRTINGKTIDIRLVEIPVIYEEVDKYVDDIWKQNPRLVIHCGVYSGARNIILEKRAENGSYCRMDFSGKCLPNSTVQLCQENCNELQTKFNIEEMAKKLNNTELPLDHRTLPSDDMYICSKQVGNYLCGYIYLKSLNIDCERTLFIHVPPIDMPYSSSETSAAILAILEQCIQQLDNNGKL